MSGLNSTSQRACLTHPSLRCVIYKWSFAAPITSSSHNFFFLFSWRWCFISHHSWVFKALCAVACISIVCVWWVILSWQTWHARRENLKQNMKNKNTWSIKIWSKALCLIACYSTVIQLGWWCAWACSWLHFPWRGSITTFWKKNITKEQSWTVDLLQWYINRESNKRRKLCWC